MKKMILLGIIASGLAGSFQASASGPWQTAPSAYDNYGYSNAYDEQSPATYAPSYIPRYDGYRYDEHKALHQDLKTSQQELRNGSSPQFKLGDHASA